MLIAVAVLLSVGVLALLNIRSHLREWHAQWEIEQSISRHNQLVASLARCHQGTFYDQDNAA